MARRSHIHLPVGRVIPVSLCQLPEILGEYMRDGILLHELFPDVVLIHGTVEHVHWVVIFLHFHVPERNKVKALHEFYPNQAGSRLKTRHGS